MEQPHTIQQVISGLQELTKNKSQEVLRKEVCAFLNDYDGEDWRKFEFWDVHKYTRNLIYQDPDNRFALILLCWNVGHYTPIHNHPDSQCFFKLLQGSLIERTYDEPDSSTTKRRAMKVRKEETLEKIGSTGYIDDGMGIHMVENPSPSTGAITLHLYTPAYLEVQCWDEMTGIKSTHGATNYSVNGEKL